MSVRSHPALHRALVCAQQTAPAVKPPWTPTGPNPEPGGFKGLVLKQLCHSWQLFPLCKTNASRHHCRVTPCFLPQQLLVQNPHRLWVTAGTFSHGNQYAWFTSCQQGKQFYLNPPPSTRAAEVFVHSRIPRPSPALRNSARQSSKDGFVCFFLSIFNECSRVTHRGSLSHTLSRWAVPDPQPHLHHPVFKFSSANTTVRERGAIPVLPRRTATLPAGAGLSVPAQPRALHSALETQTAALLSDARLTVPFPITCTASLQPRGWRCSQSRVIPAKTLYITTICSDGVPLVCQDNFCYKSESIQKLLTMLP